MEEYKEITVETNPTGQPKRVTVKRVGTESQQVHEPSQGGFSIKTSSGVGPLGCVWFILAAIAGLFVMGCAGAFALFIAGIVVIVKFINRLVGKISQEI